MSRERAALIQLVAALKDVEDTAAGVSPERGEGFQVAGNIDQDVWTKVKDALTETPKPIMTLGEAYREALLVQDACNLSGVVMSFSRILTEVLWPEARKVGGGTRWVNEHAISKLFADKVAHLTGTQGMPMDVLSAAYQEAEANKEERA